MRQMRTASGPGSRRVHARHARGTPQRMGRASGWDASEGTGQPGVRWASCVAGWWISIAGRGPRDFWDNRAMSPKSRGRPPGRGRSRKPGRRPGSGQRPAPGPRPIGGVSAWHDEETTDCWFDDPLPGDRRSWAAPHGHGTYRGLDLEQLNPDDEHERTFLLEAQHLEMEEALEAHEEIITETGETINPTLHVALHGVIANQLLNDDPPETWRTVQRLAGLGYDWHNVMHMIMGPVSSFLHQAMTAKQPFDREVYRRQLNELPGDWPSPEEIGRS